MGSWKLEVFKMGIYMMFPITLWYVYNTDYFVKTYMYPRLKKERPDLAPLFVDDDDEIIIPVNPSAKK